MFDGKPFIENKEHYMNADSLTLYQFGKLALWR
jgi:hypothetical protein